MAVVRVDIEVNDKGEASIKRFAGSMDDAGKKATGMQSILQGIGQGFGQKLVDGALAVVGGLTTAAGAAIKWADSIGVSADKMNVTAESAQRLKFIADQMDVPFSAMEKAVGKMQLAVEKSPDGFRRLGIELDTFKKLKPEDQLALLADKLNGIQDPTQRAAAGAAIFGKAWQELAPLFAAGGEAMRALGDDAERLGTVMTNDVIAAGRDMDDTLTKLTAVWDGLIRNLGAAITTSEPLHRLLNGLVEILGSFSKGVQGGTSDLRGFVDGGAILAAKALQGLMVVVSFAIDMWTVFRIATLALNTGFEQTVIWAKAAADAFLHPTRAIEIGKQALVDHEAATQRGIEAAKQEIQSNIDRQNTLINVSIQVDKLAKSVSEADGMVHKATETTKKHNVVLGESAEANKKLAAAQKAGYDLMVKEMAAYIKAYEDQQRAEAAARTAGYDQTRAEMAAFIKDYEHRLEIEREIAEEELELERKVAEARQDAHDQFISDMFALGDQLLSLGRISTTTFGQLVSGFMAGASAAKQFKDAQNGAQQGMAILNAGVSAYKSGALGGAAAGAAFGASFGPIGAGVGAVVGGLLGFIGGASRARQEMEKLRGEFIQSQGGMSALIASAEEAGVSLDTLFNAKKPEQLKAAIAGIKSELESWDEMQKKTNELVEQYGFNVEQLGEKWRNQKLDEIAGGLYEKHTLLNAVVSDHAALLEKLGPEMSDYVSTVIKSSGSIPEAMRPILQEYAKAGKLIKENGEAYTEAEIDGLNYTKSMSQMFSELISKLDDFLGKLLGLDGKKVTTNVHTNFTSGGAGTEGDTGPGGRGEEGAGGGRGRRGGAPSAAPLLYFPPRSSGAPSIAASAVPGGPGGSPASMMGNGAGGGDTYIVNVRVEGDGDASKIKRVVEEGLVSGRLQVPQRSVARRAS